MSPSRRRFRIRRRERAEAAEALHDEDGQVRAGGHGSGAERHRCGRRRSGCARGASRRRQSRPMSAPVTVDAQPIGKGIWWLAGSGNHRSVVFEFDDHLTLFEVPLNEARSKPVIDKARTLSSKPLTQVIMSHHHFDHSGGLRTAVAEGLTVITHKGNEEFFKWLVQRAHTIVPDELAKSPKPLKIQTMDDTLVLKDESMELRSLSREGQRPRRHAADGLRAARPDADSSRSVRRGMAPASVGRQHQEERRAAQAEGRSGRADPRADSKLRGRAEDHSIEADGARPN